MPRCTSGFEVLWCYVMGGTVFPTLISRGILCIRTNMVYVGQGYVRLNVKHLICINKYAQMCLRIWGTLMFCYGRDKVVYCFILKSSEETRWTHHQGQHHGGGATALKVSKRGKIRKHGVFSCIGVIKNSFSVTFNELWEGFYHNFSTKKASASGGFAPDPHQGTLPTGPPPGVTVPWTPEVPLPPSKNLSWHCPCTPLNGFPILYCTKWHQKQLRFLGYKATDCFSSWISLKIMILGNLWGGKNK